MKILKEKCKVAAMKMGEKVGSVGVFLNRAFHWCIPIKFGFFERERKRGNGPFRHHHSCKRPLFST